MKSPKAPKTSQPRLQLRKEVAQKVAKLQLRDHQKNPHTMLLDVTMLSTDKIRHFNITKDKKYQMSLSACKL